MTILEEALELKPYMVELRNYFHSHPELAHNEFNTCKYIEEKLSEIALPFKRVAGTNVIAELDSGVPGKTLLLRADIDALPIQEENDVPYKSQNSGIMHACGHDGHTAYLLGAAKILSAHKKDFKGKVIFAFQAAEEIGNGARDIINSGILDNVDRTFAIHFQSGLDVGKFAIKTGSDMASCDRLKITIHGKSSHITYPELGADSLFVGALIASQLQTVVSRLVSPVEGGLIGIGSFHSGTTYNIIPSEAVLEGTIRAFSKESRKKLADAVRKIATNIAEEYGAKADVEIEDISDPLINPTETVAEVIESAKKIVPAENIITNIEKRFMADNFADFSRKAPGTYIHAGSSDGKATSYPHHNEHFDLAEDSYHYAAALAVQYTMDYLGVNLS